MKSPSVALVRMFARIMGFLLMTLAFLQWITFEYPDVNPLWPGAILAPGMLSQILNWLVVCVTGASGWFLFQEIGKKRELES